MAPEYKLAHHQISYIQSHASLLADLPHPSEEWHRGSLPTYLQDNFQRYREVGVVDRVEEQACKTNENAWQAIQQHKPDESMLPCGHSGFTNRGTENKKPYECNACGRRFKRSDLSID